MLPSSNGKTQNETYKQEDQSIDVNDIKAFVAVSVYNDFTQQILRQILYDRCLGGKPWQKYGDEDNEVIDINSDNGKAILASPNGRGFLHFLLSHRQQLGQKTITGVKIFGTDQGNPDPITGTQPDDSQNPRLGFDRGGAGNRVPKLLGNLAYFVKDVQEE